MLEFIEISKTFNADLFKKPLQVLDDISFKINSEDVVGFLGANGAGKTTSLKVLMDFIRPTSGVINFDYKILGKTQQEVFAKIGYLPERPFFYPHLTGKEFCYYMGSLVNLSKNQINDQVSRWSLKFNIEHALDRKIHEYSKGMLQRLGFLATLLHNPKLIVLDEPLSGLDPVGRKELKDIIIEINKEGKTVFLSSHIVSDLEQICNNVIFLEKGKILYSGSVEEVIKKNTELKYNATFTKNDKFFSQEILESEKKDFLISCTQGDKALLSFNEHKPSLEEIFYKVRNL